MDAEDIPFFVALIFPGFFAIQTFSWAIPGRRMSDAMRVVWSFLFSAPIFFGLHGLLRQVGRLSTEDLPPPETIAGSAADSPVWFLVGLYVAGSAAGYILGQLWRKRVLDGPLQVIDLDVRRHRDVFTQALDQRAYIDLKLKDDTVVRGWPFMSSGWEDANEFIYLVNVQRWEPNRQWKSVRDVLIPVDMVTRIYFLDAAQPLYRPTDMNRLRDRLSWLRPKVWSRVFNRPSGALPSKHSTG